MKPKSLLFILLFALFFQHVQAQTTRTVKIYRKSQVIMNANIESDANRVNIHLMGYDSRYKAIIEILTIFYGSPKDCYDFLSDVEVFVASNSPDVSTTIDGRTVRLSKFLGAIEVDIYDQDNSGGYHTFRPKQISQLKEKLADWMRDNGMEVTVLE